MIQATSRLAAVLLTLPFYGSLPAAETSRAAETVAAELSMDQMWGESFVNKGIDSSRHGALFRDGNYGMFTAQSRTPTARRLRSSSTSAKNAIPR